MVSSYIPVLVGECPSCEAEVFRVTPMGPTPRFCSARCRARFHYEVAKKDGRLAVWRDAKNERKRVVLRQFVCAFCGLDFTARHGGRKYCTRQCTNKASYARQRAAGTYDARRLDEKKRRRARLRGAPVVEKFAALEIYERDDWVCGLCRLPIDRELQHPHLMSASVDHIVPLAQGGDHSRANVQAAHFLCNSRKGDR